MSNIRTTDKSRLRNELRSDVLVLQQVGKPPSGAVQFRLMVLPEGIAGRAILGRANYAVE
jgi:hypothetical protein